jgi:mono/diheme cytochrome c family protein
MRASHLLAVGGLLVAAMATTTSAQAQDAAALYKTKCAKCHGATGTGDGAAAKTMKIEMKDLTDAKTLADVTDAKLTELFAKGEGKMPKYDTLKPEEVKALIGYVRGMAKK